MLINKKHVKLFALEMANESGAQVHAGWRGLSHQMRGQLEGIHSQ